MVGEARSRERLADLAGAGLVVLAVALVSYWRVANAETFMRLAIRRMTAVEGLLGSLRDRRWLLALVPLGLFWVSLHGSFPVGWLLVGAALAEALVGPRRDRRRARDLALVLLVHPLFPFVSPDGLHAYDLLLD